MGTKKAETEHFSYILINVFLYILLHRRQESENLHYYIPTSSNINAHRAPYSNMSSSEMALSG